MSGPKHTITTPISWLESAICNKGVLMTCTNRRQLCWVCLSVTRKPCKQVKIVTIFAVSPRLKPC